MPAALTATRRPRGTIVHRIVAEQCLGLAPDGDLEERRRGLTAAGARQLERDMWRLPPDWRVRQSGSAPTASH